MIVSLILYIPLAFPLVSILSDVGQNGVAVRTFQGVPLRILVILIILIIIIVI